MDAFSCPAPGYHGKEWGQDTCGFAEMPTLFPGACIPGQEGSYGFKVERLVCGP